MNHCLLKRFLVLGLAIGPSSWLQAQRLESQGAPRKENLDLPYDARIEDVEEEEEAPENIQFYGQTFEGDGFFYVIDRSLTMQNKQELDVAKREVVRSISAFSPQVEFAVVFFDRGLLKFPQSGYPLKANSANKESAMSWVRGTAGGAGSCCGVGLIEALRFADRSTSKRKVIVFVGDGFCSCMDPQALLSSIRARDSHTQINTIGVIEPNREFLRQLGVSNNGTYTEITR